jgi:hypothetical protein
MNAINFILAAIALIASLGGVSAYFGKSRGDSIIKYQGNEMELYKGTIARLNEEKAAITEACSAKDATIKKLEEHNKFLQKLGQGSPQLKKLTAAIESQTKMLADVLGKKKK